MFCQEGSGKKDVKEVPSSPQKGAAACLGWQKEAFSFRFGSYICAKTSKDILQICHGDSDALNTQSRTLFIHAAYFYAYFYAGCHLARHHGGACCDDGFTAASVA